MKRETVENITGGVTLTGMFLIMGVMGGIERGGSLWNTLWCLPILAVMFATIMWCNYDHYVRVQRYKKRRARNGFRANSNR